MGKETISQTTFLKGLTTGAIIAASLGILSIGDYTTNNIQLKENNPSGDAAQVTASVNSTDSSNIKIETFPTPEIEIINETESEMETDGRDFGEYCIALLRPGWVQRERQWREQ